MSRTHEDMKFYSASNGNSNQMSATGNDNMVSNGCFSLWKSGTIISSSSSPSSDVSITDDVTSGHTEPTLQSTYNSETTDRRFGTLLGPYSKSPGTADDVIANHQIRYPQIYRPFISCDQRPPTRAQHRGSNWNTRPNNFSGLMGCGFDVNNNVIARPTWNVPRPASTFALSSSLQMATTQTNAPSYSITKQNGETVVKLKSSFANHGSVMPIQPEVDRPKRIHVSNIPFWMKENDLLILFKDYGTIQEVQVISNEKGSKVSTSSIV